MSADEKTEAGQRKRYSSNIDSFAVSYDLMQRALSVSAEGITISDPSLPDNPLIYVNEGFERLTGYMAAEVIGKNCRFLQGSQTDPRAAEEIHTAMREGRSCVVELLNHRKDGTTFWNRLSITPIRDVDGVVTHYIGVQSDITNRKEAEKALHQAKEELQQANEKMQRALESASTVQQALLPHGFHGGRGIRIAWRLEPCATLAGDTLNTFWLDETHLGCYLLDVMGHGVPAALLSVTLNHLLSPRSRGAFLLGSHAGQEASSQILSPADVGERLNQRFPLDLESSQFFTILYGILDTETLVFEYFSAGHPPMIHVSGSGIPEVLLASGFPVGVVERPGYENHRLPLRPGDRLFLYSDGVTEVQNADREPFGTEALGRAIEVTNALPLEKSLTKILNRIRSWSVRRILQDDVSILALEVVQS